MLTYRAVSTAAPEAAWQLLARPDRWREWAPHLRGAWGLGDGEVRDGARGAVRLLGSVPVPARVTAKEPGRAWTWQVGPLQVVHRVAPLPSGGCVIAMELSAPAPLEAALRVSYGPLVAVLVRRLARIAQDDARASAAVTPAAGPTRRR